MNNKRAKALRALAKEIVYNSDTPIDNVYEDNNYTKHFIKAGKLEKYTVYTRKLGQCERAIYQRLKKEFI